MSHAHNRIRTIRLAKRVAAERGLRYPHAYSTGLCADVLRFTLRRLMRSELGDMTAQERDGLIEEIT